MLLLRGPQTPGELKQRTERMAPLGTLEDVDRVLDSLVEREYVRSLGRRPGQKEDRFAQLLGGSDVDPAAVGDPASPGPLSTAPPTMPAPAAASPSFAPTTATAPRGDATDDLAARVAALEAEVAQLRAQLDELLA